MTSLPSELGVERSILTWLDGVGWETHGHDDSWGADVLDSTYERSQNEVIYWNLLHAQLLELNDGLTASDADRFCTALRRDLDHDNLMDANRAFHALLTKGKAFSIETADGDRETRYIDLIDFDTPENNRFHAVNQFSVSRGDTTIRPDVTLLVNGIPIVTMELKSLAQDNDYYDAIDDLHAYESDLSRLFVPGLFNVAADTTAFRYGAVGAATAFYQPWRADRPDPDGNELREAVHAICPPETLLDLLKGYVFYERRAGGDVKIVPRYMQYYAVNRILDRVHANEHDRGLIWHTQGSGKSFTMLYAAKNLLTRDILRSPQVFIIVDTDKLASQMRDTLSNIGFTRSVVAKSIAHLQNIIEQGQSQLVLTTIQKFQDVEPGVQGNDEVVVMSDEAHRFMEKDLGSRLDAALPNSYHFGFTGTPVREGERDTDRNTFKQFSPEGEEYLHRYSVKDGIDDNLILPVYFTLRHEMEWLVDEDGLDEHFEAAFSRMSSEEKLEFIKDEVTSKTLAELTPRVDRITQEIAEHFEGVNKNGWKGMVVTPSRKSAAMYGSRLIDQLGEDAVEVLYTSTNSDTELVRQFNTDSQARDQIVKRFKEDDELKLLVVHNMLLTGFDAPILKTMYLDRNLKNHTLMQAIARTNRVADGKENGEIVDFQGVFENIDEALDYDPETKAYAARDKDELFEKLTAQLEYVLDIFEDIPRNDSQEAVGQAIARVSKHPEKREFKQGFRRLQDLYESVSPDKRLVTEGIQDEYKWVVRINTAFQRDVNREERPEEGMREKTKEIIEEHVDIGEIKRDFPVYELGTEHLEAVEKMDRPETQATSIAHATRDHLRPKVGQNPRYKRLSQRVNEIVEAWQEGNRSDPETVAALKQIEEEVIELEATLGNDGLEDAAHAITTYFAEEVPELFEDEEHATQLAGDIVSTFDERIDRGYAGWHTNQQTISEIDRLILDVMVVEHKLSHELLTGDELFDSLRSYLIENNVTTD